MQSDTQYRQEILIQAKRWKAIYPQYLDKSSSVSQGRKVSSALAISNPTIADVAQALKVLKLHSIIESEKCYSKNWMIKGRVKAKIFDEQGNPVNPEIKNKKALLNKIAEIIPTLPDRKNKPEGQLVHGSKEFCLKMNFLGKVNPENQADDDDEDKLLTKKEKKNRRRGK